MTYNGRSGFLLLHCHTVLSEGLHNSSFKKMFLRVVSTQELTVGGFLLSRSNFGIWELVSFTDC